MWALPDSKVRLVYLVPTEWTEIQAPREPLVTLVSLVAQEFPDSPETLESPELVAQQDLTVKMGKGVPTERRARKDQMA